MPTELQISGTSPGERRPPASVPGFAPAALIAALSALLVGYWAQQSPLSSQPENYGNVSRITEVAPEDFSAALDTVAGTPPQLTQFRQREACHRALAWVTIMRAPGQAPGRIRLQSGRYISPVFELLETPVRVALPYPAPYSTGRGVVSVLGATSAAVVALTPPWHVSAQSGEEPRQVTWTPAADCRTDSK